MAITNCPECGKEVSDLAETCPHCGYPLKKTLKPEASLESTIPKSTEASSQTKQRRSGCSVFLLLLIIIGSIMYIIGSLSGTPDSGLRINQEATLTADDGFLFGCTQKDALRKLVDYGIQKDTLALDKAWRRYETLGICQRLPRNMRVVIVDMDLGLYKIRPKGRLEEYWVLKEFVSP